MAIIVINLINGNHCYGNHSKLLYKRILCLNLYKLALVLYNTTKLYKHVLVIMEFTYDWKVWKLRTADMDNLLVNI